MKVNEEMIKKMQNKSTMGEFISKLFESQIQTHILHLNTKSYAQHMALNGYYTALPDLIDLITEAWQGKYGILKGYTKTVSISETLNPVTHLTSLRDYINQARYVICKDKVDSNIQNEIDNVITLIDTTLYKLENLK